MHIGSHILPDIFADAVLDLNVEGGVFRLTLAQAVPQANGGEAGQYNLMPKAVLLLTERGFMSLCEVVDEVRKQMMLQANAGEEAGSSPNFSS